jgi:hypothetical protein
MTVKRKRYVDANRSGSLRAPSHRFSGLVYAREGVLFAGCKSLSELATAP